MCPASNMILRLPILIAACTTCLWAQDKTISVRTLALRDAQMPELYLKAPKEHTPLKWSHRQPGASMEVLFANPLPIYRREMDEEGQEIFKVVSKVKFPSSAREMLLLGWQSENVIRCIGIKDRFREAGFDDWLLINAATKPVAFNVGDGEKMTVVRPGKTLDYRIRVPRGKGATVTAKMPIEGGTAKTFYSTFWPIHPNKRAVIIFVDDGEKIRVKRISDKLLVREP